MASVTAICNLALQKLGGGFIVNLTDNTKEARSLNRIYDYVRDAALRVHPWNFAVTRAQLPALVAVPAWGWSYQFELPADFLRLLEIENYKADQFDVEAGKVLTNSAGPLNIRYIARVTDVNFYDPLFVDVLATRLAIELCEDLTQSNTKKQALEQDYVLALERAKGVDGQESPPGSLPEDSWLEARL